MKEFTVENGIKVQDDQLKEWAVVLKSEVLEDLKTWVRATNENAKDGYQIRRGSDMSNFIANYPRWKKEQL